MPVRAIQTLQAAFVDAGVAAVAVDGKTPKAERADLLHRFRAGEVPVRPLVSVPRFPFPAFFGWGLGLSISLRFVPLRKWG